MKTRLIASVLLASALALAAPAAHAAEGVLVAPARIPTAARTALAADIAKARAKNPEPFQAFASLRASVAELDAKKRGRLAPLTPRLRAMGPDALLPMLEHVAFDAPSRGSLTPAAWLALRVSLLEAIGAIRDPRAVPVLIAVLDGDTDEEPVVRAAAAALGAMNTDAAAQKLVALATTPGAKQRGVVLGMGECRRESVAKALASIVDKGDTALVHAAVKALGDVGNAWAWKTPAVAASGEEASTRAAAVRALVQAFVRTSGETRDAATTALLVVDSPETPALIAAAKSGASADLAAALDVLAERFAKSTARLPAPPRHGSAVFRPEAWRGGRALLARGRPVDQTGGSRPFPWTDGTCARPTFP